MCACAGLIAAYNFDVNLKVSKSRPPATAQPLSHWARRHAAVSLTPFAAPSGRLKIRRFSRALLAVPMPQPAAILWWRRGRFLWGADCALICFP